MSKYSQYNAADYDYSINHLIDDRAFEPQRTNHSYIQFNFPSDLRDIHGNKLKELYDNNAPQSSNNGLNKNDPNTILRLSLTSHGMPNQSSENIQIRKGNEVISFAGGVSYDNIDIRVTDWVGVDTENMIAAWDALRYNPKTGVINPAYRYKMNGNIVQYSSDGAIVRSWTLKGAWIDQVKYGEYNRSEAGSEREISFTCHIDKAYPDPRIDRSSNI